MTSAMNPEELPQATDSPLIWWAKILGGDVEANLAFTSGSLSRPDEVYVGLANPAKPTMLVDASSRPGLVAAVAKPGAGPVRSLAGKALRVPGAAKLLPRRLGLSSPRPTMRQFLSDVVDDNIVLSASCGPLRPNRKPVVRALDDRGAMHAVAKVGWDPMTSGLVQTEATAIARINQASPAAVVAPLVLREERWRGLEVLVVSPLPISGSRAPEQQPDATLGALSEIAAIDRTSSAIESAGFVERLYDRLAGIAETDPEPLLSLERLIADGLTLDIGGFHGDWSPWNTQPLESGRLLVWDWERFASDVPVGIDLVHYLFQVERFVNKHDPAAAYAAVAERASELLPELEVDPDLAQSLVTLYLLEAIARNSEGALSAQLTDRRSLLIDALRSDVPVDSDSRKVA